MRRLGVDVGALAWRQHKVELGKIEAISSRERTEVIARATGIGRVIKRYSRHTIVDSAVDTHTCVRVRQEESSLRCA